MNLIPTSAGAGEVIKLRSARSRAAVAKLWRLWPLRDIRIPINGECAGPRFVLFFMIAKRDASALRMLDDFLYSNTDLSEALLKFGENIGWTVTMCVVVVLCHLPWFEQVLRFLAHRLPFLTFFTRAEPGWKKRRGSQAMIWRSFGEVGFGLDVGWHFLPS